MSDVPSPIEVTSWPQVVALGFLLAFLAVPQIIGYLTTSRIARGARDGANAAAETVSEVKQTLTENNGGSSVKDYLDRFEEALKQVRAEQADVRARLDASATTITEEIPDAPNP